MDRVRDWLWIGKYSETRTPALLEVSGITAMLQLGGEVKQPGVEHLYVGVDDAVKLPHERIKEGIEYVRDARARGKVCLVACGAGISRASTYTTAVLHEEEGLDLVAAFREVARAHPISLPHPLLWESLCEYYGRWIDYRKLFG